MGDEVWMNRDLPIFTRILSSLDDQPSKEVFLAVVFDQCSHRNAGEILGAILSEDSVSMTVMAERAYGQHRGTREFELMKEVFEGFGWDWDAD